MKKSHYNIKNNKKGNWFVDNLGQIVLTAIGIGIGIYFLWAFVLHGGGDSVNKLQKCGALTGNKGECKESCDKSLELELPNVGCSGVADKCCVLKDDSMNDVILPSSYGFDSSNKYDFIVTGISIEGGEAGLPNTCRTDTRSGNSIKCEPNVDIEIPITISVSNTGSEPVIVKADPVYVIMDNGDKVREHQFKGTAASIPVKGQASVITKIIISSTEAKQNAYWEIYPYAICDEKACQAADASASRGIYRKDPTNSMMLTIKFVPPTTT